MSFFRLLALHRRQAKYQRTKPQAFRTNLELLESRTLVTADLLTSVPLAMYSTAGSDSTGIISAATSAPSVTAADLTSSPAAAAASMRYVLSIVDGSGNPITGPLNVGDKFWVQVSVQDLRSGYANAGIAQAGTAVNFDSTLATPTGQVTAGASYPVGLSSSLSTPGQFSVNSSEQYDINLPNAYAPLGSGLFTLASVQMTANAPGALTFTTAFPPDNPTGAQSVIAVDADGAGNIGYVLPGNVTQGTTSIQISAAASQLSVSAQPPQTVAHGGTFDVKVAVQDGGGNTVTNFTGNVTIALGNNPGGATLGGTTTVAAANGVADFSNLTINNPGQGYTLQATATGLTAATSSSFSVAGDASQLAITTQPLSSIAAGSSFDVKVSAEDSLGTVVPNFTGSVSIALGANPGGSTLGGTTTVTAAAGVADFSTLSLDKVGAGYTLVATSGALTSPASNTFTVTAAAASHLVVTTQPAANVTAGSPLEVKVTAEDAEGNVDTSFNGNVTIALNNPGSAVLGGTLTVAATGGVADFTNLTVNKAGTGYTLAVTSGALPSVNTSAFDVTPAAVSQLVVTTQPPASVTAGSVFDVKVTAEDQYGNINSSYTGNVSIALAANPGSATLGGTLTVAATGGVADFSTLNINKSGAGYTLLPSASGLSSTPTSAITVTPATVTQLFVTQQPTTVAAGTAFDVKVAAQDQFGNTDTSFTGNVVLAIANNPAGGTLGGTLTVAAVNGVADFGNLTLDKPGTGYTLSATSGAATAAATGAIDVTPGAATQIVIATSPPAGVTAGAQFDVQVNVLDALGNLATNFSGTVTIALANNPTSATLGGTTTVNVTSGVADFSTLDVTKVGAGYTLAVTGTSLTSATTSAFNVTPAAASKLVVTTQPAGSVAAGNTFTMTVSAEDQFGNVDTNFSGNVTLAIANNPASGTLSGTTSVAAAAGVAHFTNLSLDKAGTGYTLTATSGALGAGTTTAINVTPAAATHLAVTLQPNPNVTLNAGFTVKISAEDQSGNVDPNFTGNVTIALNANPNNATLGGTTTVAAVAGVATFSGLTLDQLGAGNSLQASNSAFSSVTTNAFAVTAAGVATHLVVTAQPSGSVTAGQTFDVKVSAEDDHGAVDTTFAGSVAIAIANNPGSATLGGTLTATAANGVADFAGLTLNKAGTGYTLQATVDGLGSGTTAALNVTPAAATHLVITTQPPSSTVAGAAFDVTVSAEDQFGNVDTNYTSSVALTLANNPGNGTLGGTATLNATAGVANFGTLTLNKVGTGYTLSAASGTFTSVNTTAINVTPAAATKFVITTQPPSTTVAGAAFEVKLTAEDQFGNVDTNYTGNVTIALATNPTSATLGGTTTATAAAGIVDFTGLSLTKAGTGYTLQAAATGVTSPATTAFNVTPAAAAKLAFTQVPSSVAKGSAFAVQVSAEDQFGNVNASATGTVTLAIGNNPSAGTLGGTLTATLTNGVASFSGLTLNQQGTGYTLTATSAGLTTATSAALNVTSPAATQVVITTQPPSTVTSMAPFEVKVALQDPDGNIDTSFNGNVTIAIANNPASGTLGGTLTVAAVNGVADFTNLTLNKAGTGYTLKITSGSLTSATTSATDVTVGAASQLAVKSQSTTAVAGTAFDVQFAVEDAGGNIVTSSTGNVTIALTNNPGGATLTGPTTIPLINGVADFSALSLDKAGTGYTFTATSGALISPATAGITITAAAASQLLVTTQPPASVTSGAPFDVKVTAQDKFGNVATSFNGSVLIGLTAGTPTVPGVTAKLGGTQIVTAVNGVADFSTLTIDKVGTGYQLTATNGPLTTAPTTDITVGVGAAAKLDVTAEPPGLVLAGATFGLNVSVEDAQGNLVTSATGSVTLTIQNNPAGGTLGGTAIAAVTNGVATFTGLSLDKVGNGYTLAATSGVLTGAQTTAINVGALGTFSGAVYVDTNNDGSFQSGEHGIAGVTLTLTGTTTGGQSVTQTTTTAADGTFSFQQLAPGTYTISEAMPSQYVLGHASPAVGVTSSGNTQFTFRIDPNSVLTGNNFAARGLQPQLLNRSYFIGSRL